MPPNRQRISTAGVSLDGRNPIILDVDRLNWVMVNTAWVAEMCAKYGTECEHPQCSSDATQALLSLYSCTFICDLHAVRMDDSEMGKMLRVITTDLIDIDVFSSFMSRSFVYLDRRTGGMLSELSKQQLKDLKRLDNEDRDREHDIRMRIRRLQKSSGVREGMPAHVAYEAEIGNDKWMAIQYDPRKKIDSVVIPLVLAVDKKFAPELHNLPENKSGIDDVEEIF